MLPFQLKFHVQKLLRWPKRLIRSLNPLRIALLAAALLLCVGGFLWLRGSRKATPDTSSFSELEELVIGIATPSAFAQADADGAPKGYERAVAEAVFAQIYPDKKLIFRTISAQEASYLLRQGEIHVALGMYVSGPLKTQGLSLSNSYFTDGVYAFCPEESPIDSLWGLTNTRVRVLTSDITKSAVASMFKELDISVELHLCSSYPDGLESLQRGDCTALIGPRYKLEGYDGLRRIEEPIGFASYRFMVWTEQADVTELINGALSRLRSNGTLAELQLAWDVDEYSAP